MKILQSIISENEPQRLTEDWQPYTGGYLKQPYALRLANGREIEWAWPNDGHFHPDRSHERIPLGDVTHIKRGKNWHLCCEDDD